MSKREKIELGNKVKFAKTRDGHVPYPNWVGIVLEIKNVEGEEYFAVRVKFDYNYVLPKEHPCFYITEGLWYKSTEFEVVDNEIPVGYQK